MRQTLDSYLGFEPVMESNNVSMLHPLQQDHLVVHHPLISLDILLEDDFDGVSLAIGFGLSDDAICSRTKCPAEAILCSMHDPLASLCVFDTELAAHFLS